MNKGGNLIIRSILLGNLEVPVVMVRGVGVQCSRPIVAPIHSTPLNYHYCIRRSTGSRRGSEPL